MSTANDAAVLNSLLGPFDHVPSEQLVDRNLAKNNVEVSTSNVVKRVAAKRYHNSLVSQKCDAQLIYHMAGYVARTRVLSLKCKDCSALLLTALKFCRLPSIIYSLVRQGRPPIPSDITLNVCGTT